MEPNGKIFSLLKHALTDLPKTEVSHDGLFYNIAIKNRNVFVPDFVFNWDIGKQHYRVYIHLATSTTDKQNAGYCICTIGSILSASGFVVLYQFLHKHRPNNKNQD